MAPAPRKSTQATRRRPSRSGDHRARSSLTSVEFRSDEVEWDEDSSGGGSSAGSAGSKVETVVDLPPDDMDEGGGIPLKSCSTINDDDGDELANSIYRVAAEGDDNARPAPSAAVEEDSIQGDRFDMRKLMSVTMGRRYRNQGVFSSDPTQGSDPWVTAQGDGNARPARWAEAEGDGTKGGRFDVRKLMGRGDRKLGLFPTSPRQGIYGLRRSGVSCRYSAGSSAGSDDPSTGSSKLWDRLEDCSDHSQITDVSPRTEQRRRRQRRRTVFVLRCAKFVLGIVALAALSGSVAHLVPDKSYELVVEFFSKNNTFGRVLNQDWWKNAPSSRRLPQGLRDMLHKMTIT